MRQRRLQKSGDTATIDVLLVEDKVVHGFLTSADDDGGDDPFADDDEPVDPFQALLHQLALEAVTLRAGSPGDPRTEPDVAPPWSVDPEDERPAAWVVRRLGRRRLVRWAVVATVVLGAAVTAEVADARQAAARLAEMKGASQVLASAASAPVERWREPGQVIGVQGDLLLVAAAPAGAVRWVDPATGTTQVAGADPGAAVEQGLRADVGGLPTAAGTEEHTLPGGALVSWEWDPDGDSGHGVVTKPDGLRFTLWERPLVPAMTDGSATGTLVAVTTDGRRLHGRDVSTGVTRWSLPYEGTPTASAVALVDGVMLLDDGDTMTAIDIRTGDGLWRTEIAAEITGGAVLTDTDVVALPIRGLGGELQLAAVGIRSGEPLWRIAAPAGTVSIAVVGHYLVASTGDAVVGLG